MTTAQAHPVAGGVATRLAGGPEAHLGRHGPIAAAIAISGLVVFLRQRSAESILRGMDPDSAMRLVQVRDLLNGQGWFDLTQHRLGMDTGVEMHWSRLVDAPMAAFLWVAGRFVGPSAAEHLLLVLWPTLWLAVTAWAVLSLSRHLGGPFASVVAFLVTAPVLLSTPIFLPGSLDHHNVQLTLLMLALWGLAARHTVRGASALAGLCVATSLTVGTELLPVMAMVCIGISVVWTARGASERRAVIGFGSALAAGITGQFLLLAPTSAYAGGHCDAISMDLLLPVAGCALALVLAALWVSERGATARLGVLIMAGGAVVLAAVTDFPACLANPLDRLDPLLVHYWLNGVNEAQGILATTRGEMGGSFALLYAVAAASVPLLLVLIRLGTARAECAMLLGALVVTAVFAAYQVRYLFFLVFLSLPVWASVIAYLRGRVLGGGSLSFSLVTAAVSLVALAPGLAMAVPFALPWSAAGQRASGQAEANAALSHFHCLAGDDFYGIASLPPGRVASTSNLGAYVLLWSEHEAISAPYHRNQAGMLGQLSVALAESPAEAEGRLRELGVDYLVLCKVDPELRLRRSDSPEEPLLVRLVDGDVTLEGYPLLLQEGEIYVFGRIDG